MPHYQSSIVVPNAVSDAFSFVKDFRNTAKWDPRVSSAENLTAGPIALGTRFQIVSKLLWTTLNLPYEITEFEPDRRLVLRGKNWLLSYRDVITFEAEGAGAQLTYGASISLRGMFALGTPILKWLFGRIGDDAVAGIQRALVAEHIQASTSVTAAGATPERVAEIVAMDDQPIVRNLLITQTYHHLSERLGQMLGRDNANWCTYATWASKAAGLFIREDEVPEAFRELLAKKEGLRDRVRELNDALCLVDPEASLYTADDLNPIGEVIDEVGLYIQTGNKIVFAELGGVFADFVTTFEGDTEPDPDKLQEFLARLRSGESMPDTVELAPDRDDLVSTPRGGQDLLRAAMTHYYDAMFETDAKRKAELILLGNALGGLHEQTRLDPYIDGSLNAPVDEILYSRNNDALVQRLAKGVLGQAQEVMNRRFKPLGEQVTETFRQLSTRVMMQMSVPGETLRLGRDLPAPRGEPLFPRILSPVDRPDLASILQRFGAAGDGRRQSGSGKSRVRAVIKRVLVLLRLRRPRDVGSGASDWSELSQRVRYIFAYFRSRQRDATLLQAPFDAQQTTAILQGRVPGGEL